MCVLILFQLPFVRVMIFIDKTETFKFEMKDVILLHTAEYSKLLGKYAIALKCELYMPPKIFNSLASNMQIESVQSTKSFLL